MSKIYESKTSSDEPTNENDLIYRFFELHANQRMTLFKYFITIITALLLSYFYIFFEIISKANSFTHFNYIIFIFNGMFIYFISNAFNKLDKRNEELINKAKDQSKILMELSDCKNQITTHSTILTWIFRVSLFLGCFLTAAAIFKYVYDICPKTPPTVAESIEGPVSKMTSSKGNKGTENINTTPSALMQINPALPNKRQFKNNTIPEQ